MTSYYANIRKYLYQNCLGFFSCMTRNMQHKTSLNSYTDVQDFSWEESPSGSWGSVWNTNTPALLFPGEVRWPEQAPHLKLLHPCGCSIYLQWHNFSRLRSSHCSPGWFRRVDVLTLTHNESSSLLSPNRVIFMHWLAPFLLQSSNAGLEASQHFLFLPSSGINKW